MSSVKKWLQCVSLLVLSGYAVAGSNPIAWALTQSFPSTISASDKTYLASYTFTNTIPLTLLQPLTIKKTATPVSEFTYDDLCSGRRLAHRETCTVLIYLKPTTSGINIDIG